MMTMTLADKAVATASCWVLARATPSLVSTQGMAFSGARTGHGGAPLAKVRKRSAMACSASHR